MRAWHCFVTLASLLLLLPGPGHSMDATGQVTAVEGNAFIGRIGTEAPSRV